MTSDYRFPMLFRGVLLAFGVAGIAVKRRSPTPLSKSIKAFRAASLSSGAFAVDRRANFGRGSAGVLIGCSIPRTRPETPAALEGPGAPERVNEGTARVVEEIGIRASNRAATARVKDVKKLSACSASIVVEWAVLCIRSTYADVKISMRP